MDFENVARMAFREAARKAGCQLLEPVMQVEVTAPQDYTGAVTGDLNRRRGLLLGIDSHLSVKAIKAEVPLRELFGYVTRLRTLTAGRGNASMQFAKYAPVPKQAKVMA